MADFVEAARLDELPPGKSVSITIEGKLVGLFNVDGQIYAIDDICPHTGASLGLGKLNGRIVTCAHHGMKLDVVTRCFPAGTGFAVASYAVLVVAGKIMVSLEAQPPAI
jgi:3-phenylpropionate/trans-cinnamate dioxygenase ferredoxin subunit